MSTTTNEQEPEPEDGPVEGDADVGVDGPDRADRGQRGQPYGDPDCQECPGHDRAENADEPVRHRHGRTGAQRAEIGSVLRISPDQAADQAADHKTASPATSPNTPKAIASGRMARSALAT